MRKELTSEFPYDLAQFLIEQYTKAQKEMVMDLIEEKVTGVERYYMAGRVEVSATKIIVLQKVPNPEIGNS